MKYKFLVIVWQDNGWSQESFVRNLGDAISEAKRYVAQPPGIQVFFVEIRDRRKPYAEQVIWSCFPSNRDEAAKALTKLAG